MSENKVSRFFLGANSAAGFYSLSDDFARPEDGDFLWVIKGGPGCGKSTFMKRIGKAAEDAGLDVEYILCSGDPDSLDGVYFPALKTGYADGTAPHVMDPPYPAAAGLYLDLGAFYDPAALEPLLPEIAELNRKYRALYVRAYGSLAAAGAMEYRDYPGLIDRSEVETALRRAAGAVGRELGHAKGGPGRLKRRFLSAVTCQGRIFLEDTLNSLCDRVYTLDNEYGLAWPYLELVAYEAQARGFDAILCPEPLDPKRPEALLIPSLGLAFLCIDSRRGFGGEAYRHVRLDAVLDIERLRQLRSKLRNMARLRESLLEDAVETLAEAYRVHCELESLYNPHVDFEALYALTDEHAAWLQKAAEKLEKG